MRFLSNRNKSLANRVFFVDSDPTNSQSPMPMIAFTIMANVQPSFAHIEPNTGEAHSGSNILSWIKKSLFAPLCIGAWITWQYSGLETDTIGSNQPDHPAIFVNQPSVNLGDVASGRVNTCSYVIKNTNQVTVTLLGSKPSCSCTIVDGLPAKLAPSEEKEIRLRIAAPEEPVPFFGNVILYTDDPRCRELGLAYEGRCIPKVVEKTDDQTNLDDRTRSDRQQLTHSMEG